MTIHLSERAALMLGASVCVALLLLQSSQFQFLLPPLWCGAGLCVGLFILDSPGPSAGAQIKRLEEWMEGGVGRAGAPLSLL